MDEETKRSSLERAEAIEDARAGIAEEMQYDAVFGEISEDGPNYRSVRNPAPLYPLQTIVCTS